LEEKMNIGKINNGTAINNREESTPMKKNHWKWIPLLVIAFGVTSACNLIAARTPEPGASDANAIHTQAAQTVIAQLTQAATNITPTMELPTQTTEAPTQAPPPTETQAPATPTQAPPTPTSVPPTPTATPIPCDWAQFVGDVNVPDYTTFSPGSDFTKTWRLKNIGSCTWTGDYDLVFVNGNAMSDRVSYPLPASVRPGETIDLSAKMTAPAGDGNYKGSWMLRNDIGELFGIGGDASGSFWVLIKVIRANPDYAYDFAANYCNADWRTGSGGIDCPSSPSSSKGFVTLLDNPVMENRHDDEPAIWTHPDNDDDGWITGTYPQVDVQDGHHFKAWIGCLDDSRGCNVIFRLDYQINGSSIRNLGEWHEVYDGQATEVDVDLRDLAGKSVQFILSVEVAGGKSEQANAFWFVPAIKKVDLSQVNIPAVQAARQTLAQAKGVDKNDVRVTRFETVEWSDTCLGVHTEGQVCGPAIIPGYRVLLETGGRRYEAHTNQDGTAVRWFEL
jgi:hypothetical protein